MNIHKPRNQWNCLKYIIYYCVNAVRTWANFVSSDSTDYSIPLGCGLGTSLFRFLLIYLILTISIIMINLYLKLMLRACVPIKKIDLPTVVRRPCSSVDRHCLSRPYKKETIFLVLSKYNSCPCCRWHLLVFTSFLFLHACYILSPANLFTSFVLASQMRYHGVQYLIRSRHASLWPVLDRLCERFSCTRSIAT